MIRVSDVSVILGGVRALAATSFELAPGARLGVTGPNGSGKSTLLRVLAGLLEPTAGRVEGLPPPGRVVLVHQRPHLFRGTARFNVALGARLSGRPSADADRWLDALGLAHVAHRPAAALSGGERRRVALARAFARQPEVLLLDEPCAELDAPAVERVMALLSRFTGTVVVAAPDLGPAPVTRVLALSPG